MLVELSQEQLNLMHEVLQGSRQEVGTFIANNEFEDEGLSNHYKDLINLEEYIDETIANVTVD